MNFFICQHFFNCFFPLESGFDFSGVVKCFVDIKKLWLKYDLVVLARTITLEYE